jgi:hypothetical protein
MTLMNLFCQILSNPHPAPVIPLQVPPGELPLAPLAENILGIIIANFLSNHHFHISFSQRRDITNSNWHLVICE